MVPTPEAVVKIAKIISDALTAKGYVLCERISDPEVVIGEVLVPLDAERVEQAIDEACGTNGGQR